MKTISDYALDYTTDAQAFVNDTDTDTFRHLEDARKALKAGRASAARLALSKAAHAWMDEWDASMESTPGSAISAAMAIGQARSLASLI